MQFDKKNNDISNSNVHLIPLPIIDLLHNSPFFFSEGEEKKMRQSKKTNYARGLIKWSKDNGIVQIENRVI
jgi:hypothetical protein